MEKRTITTKRYKKTTILVFVVIFTMSLLMLAGCSTETEAEGVEDTQVKPAQVVEEDLEIEATPLDDEAAELSLEGYGAIGADNDEDPSLTDMLMYAVQDEYLAHGEYLAIIEKFGDQRPYTNIIKAEETHLSLLREIYESYELDFPSDDSAEHIIVPDDLLEAAKTGVQAELDNIAMYEKFLSLEIPEDVEAVFNELKNGSESHLLAFQKQVDRLK